MKQYIGSNCAVCGVQLPESPRTMENRFKANWVEDTRIYCSNACRQKSYRSRKRQTVKGGVSEAAQAPPLTVYLYHN